MSEKPKTLTAWDFPDTIQVPDGYDLTSKLDNTRENMEVLMDEHNKLVEYVLDKLDK